MKKLNKIEFVAEDAGYFEVFKDEEQISQHSTIYKAQEKATNLQIEFPDGNIYFKRVLKINVTPSFEIIEEDTSTESGSEDDGATTDPEEDPIDNPVDDSDSTNKDDYELSEPSEVFSFTTGS